MEKNNTPTRLLTRKITMAAMTIAVSLLVSSVFRNTSSILSAIIVPIILSIFLSSFTIKEYTFVSFTLLFLTLILITTQTVFMSLYILHGQTLIFLFLKSKPNKRMHYFYYLILVSLSLFIGILLTELIFNIPLHLFMMNLAKNNYLIYAAIILFEGLLISSFHVFLILRVHKSLVNSRYFQ